MMKQVWSGLTDTCPCRDVTSFHWAEPGRPSVQLSWANCLSWAARLARSAATGWAAGREGGGRDDAQYKIVTYATLTPSPGVEQIQTIHGANRYSRIFSKENIPFFQIIVVCFQIFSGITQYFMKTG